MRTYVPARVLVATLLLSQLGSPAASGESGLHPLPDRISVRLIAVQTPDGASNHEVASGGAVLKIGEEGTAYLLAGTHDAGGSPVRQLCVGQVGSGNLDESAVAKAANVWRAKVSVLSATMASIVLAVDWSRASVDAQGVLTRIVGDRRTVTLREGEQQTLDFIESAPTVGGCGIALRVDVAASIVEDERFEGNRIRYEMWLVDQAPGRPADARRFVTTAEHGEKVDFKLDALRWDLVGATLKNGMGIPMAAQAVAAIQGSIRGRIRDDGSIDILLDAKRQVGITEIGKPLGGGLGDGGEKALTLFPAETLGLVLPPAGGTQTMTEDGTSGSTFAGVGAPGPVNGLKVASGRVAVDFGKFLAGHTMSLRLNASRVSESEPAQR